MVMWTEGMALAEVEVIPPKQGFFARWTDRLRMALSFLAGAPLIEDAAPKDKLPLDKFYADFERHHTPVLFQHSMSLMEERILDPHAREIRDTAAARAKKQKNSKKRVKNKKTRAVKKPAISDTLSGKALEDLLEVKHGFWNDQSAQDRMKRMMNDSFRKRYR